MSPCSIPAGNHRIRCTVLLSEMRYALICHVGSIDVSYPEYIVIVMPLLMQTI
jgi:hypothetical protein